MSKEPNFVFTTELEDVDINALYDDLVGYILENANSFLDLKFQKTLTGYEIHFWGDLGDNEINVREYIIGAIYG